MTENKPAAKKSTRKAPAKKASKEEEPTPQQVPSSAPVRLEVRYNGKIRYAQQVWNPTFDIGDDSVTISASLKPEMVDAPKLAPPTVFAAQNDVRDGEDFIPRVHSGRRDLPQQDTVTTDWPAGSPQAEQVAEESNDDDEDDED